MLVICSILTSHLEEELDVARPDLKTLEVLLAEFFVNILDKINLVAIPVNVNQLKVYLFAIVNIKGTLDNILKLLGCAKLALQVHECDPQV